MRYDASAGLLRDRMTHSLATRILFESDCPRSESISPPRFGFCSFFFAGGSQGVRGMHLIHISEFCDARAGSVRSREAFMARTCTCTPCPFV